MRRLLTSAMEILSLDFYDMPRCRWLDIVTEAALSFLGFGLPPDAASWGGMLSWEGRRYMEMAPRITLCPGVTLSVVVWGTNMFGDALTWKRSLFELKP